MAKAEFCRTFGAFCADARGVDAARRAVAVVNRPCFSYNQADGALAEWLRGGLQNLLHRFNSGRRLQICFYSVGAYSAARSAAIARKSTAMSGGYAFATRPV